MNWATAVRPFWHLPGALDEELLAIGPDLPFWRDVSVEGLACNSELGAQLGDLCLRLAHSCLCEAQLGWRHLERTPAMSTACACGRQTGSGMLDDQFALELGKAGEDREHQAAVGGGGVNRRAFARQHLQPDAALRQVADRVDEVAQISP